jgi:hypothetical protein
MLKTIALTAATLLLASGPVCAGLQPETLTLFDHAQRSWGVGTIHVSKPLAFRDGKLLVFPAQFTDLLWAPDGSKPRNMMIVHEPWPDDDKDKPFLSDKDDFFAPILLLPEHAFYKDNLPPTPRHQIAGGRRYVFRGEQIPEVRKILEAWFKASDAKGANRFREKVVAVASALESTIPYVREDAVTWFTVYPTLARDFDDRALPSVKAYLAGSAPAEEKAKLIDALVAAKIESVKPLVQEQAKANDASGAAALRAIAESGERKSTDELLTMSRATSVDVQAYALEQIGARAGTEDAAFARCKEVLDQVTSPTKLMHGCLRGLRHAKGKAVNDLLVFVVERGDSGSREAALALAGSNSPETVAELTRILKEKTGEPAIAAAMGLARTSGCEACAEELEEQHHDHKDEMVRNVIGVLLGVPMVHKH